MSPKEKKPTKAAPEWANHPGLEGLKVKDNYYMVDQEAIKYDGALLAKAVDIVTKSAKGNILVADAQALYELVVDANIYTETEQRTVQLIRSNFKFTPAAEKKLVSMLDEWEAKHGIKPDKAPAPEAVKPEATKPKAAKPKATKPKATKPKVAKPKATKPKATKPKVAEPKVAEPKVAEPKVTEPKVAKPKAAEPKVAKPKKVKPKVSQTEVAQPEVEIATPEPQVDVSQFIDDAEPEVVPVVEPIMQPTVRQRIKAVPRTKAKPGESKGGKEDVYQAPTEIKPVEPSGPIHPMRLITIAKVVANIGVGEAGEKLLKAESVLTKLTGAKPVRTISRTTNRDLGIRKGAPIGCKVTLRGESAAKLLREALWVRENRIFDYSISRTGCLSFGIPDYTSFPDQKYDPDIGIFGLDLSVVLQRPGHRVRHRRLHNSPLGRDQKINREDAKEWLVNNFQVEVVT